MVFVFIYNSCRFLRSVLLSFIDFLQVLKILCGSDEVLGSAAGRNLLQRCLSDVFSYGKEHNVYCV